MLASHSVNLPNSQGNKSHGLNQALRFPECRIVFLLTAKQYQTGNKLPRSKGVDAHAAASVC